MFWEVAKWNNTRLYLCMQGNIKIVGITDNLLKSLLTNVSPYFSDSSSKILSKLYNLKFTKKNQEQKDMPQLNY